MLIIRTAQGGVGGVVKEQKDGGWRSGTDGRVEKAQNF